VETSWLSLVLAVLAFGLGLYSFWWINIRPGKLRVSSPINFAGGISAESTSILQLPFVLYNDGANGKFISDIKLLVGSVNRENLELKWIGSVDELGQFTVVHAKDQFAVLPKNSTKIVSVFRWPTSRFQWLEDEYNVELHAKLNNDHRWTNLHAFQLKLGNNAKTELQRVVKISRTELPIWANDI
jgi:hypothetical protein